MITFFAQGRPLPKGSMRGFCIKGRAVLTSSTKNLKPGQRVISHAAKAEMDGERPVDYAVNIYLEFYFLRPKNHFVANNRVRGLKESAPEDMISRPDIDKLARSTLDGLTGVVYDDDSRAIMVEASKQWCELEREQGVFVRVDRA